MFVIIEDSGGLNEDVLLGVAYTYSEAEEFALEYQSENGGQVLIEAVPIIKG